jgi:hypothetical protein
MNEIIQRLFSRSPKIFRQIQRVCLALIGIAGAVLALEAAYGIELSPNLSHALEQVLITCTIAGGIAKLAVEGGYEKGAD